LKGSKPSGVSKPRRRGGKGGAKNKDKHGGKDDDDSAAPSTGFGNPSGNAPGTKW
jgi:hypothetical protein